jgi:small Trp-rich protein
MAFLIIGVLLLAGKLAEIGPMGEWPWWVVLTPFGLATLWWAISDKLGLTQRKAMQRMDERKEKRRTEAMEALGLNKKRVKQVSRAEEQSRRGDGASADPTNRG